MFPHVLSVIAVGGATAVVVLLVAQVLLGRTVRWLAVVEAAALVSMAVGVVRGASDRTWAPFLIAGAVVFCAASLVTISRQRSRQHSG